MSETEETAAPASAPPSQAELTRQAITQFVTAALPMVLQHLYPDPPPRAEWERSTPDFSEPDYRDEFAVTFATAGGPSLGKVPRPEGDGWEAETTKLEAGGVTVLWRREVEVRGEPSFHGNAV